VVQGVEYARSTSDSNLLQIKEERKMTRKRTCCICGEALIGYGNNPWPVEEEGECCDQCNWKYVVPARFEMLKEDDNNEV
jgi:hypothetical protein